MFKIEDMYVKTAIEAAMKSGFFIRKSVGRIGPVTYKGRDNIVTGTDKRSEEMIIKRIRSSFPGHSILSEERRPINRKSPYRWIIDPIDGTTNFAHSFPFFSVSIALEYEAEVVLGVVYDPMRDELFFARKGGGARLNRRKIFVSKVTSLSRALLATGFSYGPKNKDRNLNNFGRMLTRSQAIRRAGSAALDLCYVACSRFDGFWEMDLHPWDTAAASLIVRESRGSISTFDGSEYSPFKKEVLATNGYIHKQMVGLLQSA